MWARFATLERESDSMGRIGSKPIAARFFEVDMTYTRQQIADACRRQAAKLDATLLDGYDAARLLWAICGNESSFGHDCTPRHEPAYDMGGTYAKAPTQAALLVKFGSHGACSYGPMQVMLVDAPFGTAPIDFDDLDKAIAAGAFALNRLLRANKPTTMAQIGACYNGGHVPKGIWPDGIRRYADELIRNYAEPMPDALLKG